MKFLIVTCLKECQEEVFKIFKLAKIHVFSVTDVIGVKEHQTQNLLQDWLASGEEEFNSLVIFSFTAEENADLAMELIIKYNETQEPGFPVRAFIVPVEKSNYQ